MEFTQVKQVGWQDSQGKFVRDLFSKYLTIQTHSLILISFNLCKDKSHVKHSFYENPEHAFKK
jgi:hypothetical protein